MERTADRCTLHMFEMTCTRSLASEARPCPPSLILIVVRCLTITSYLRQCCSLAVVPAGAQSQAQMNEQARASFESADVELNTIYKRLLNQLEDAEAKQKLRERAWLLLQATRGSFVCRRPSERRFSSPDAALRELEGHDRSASQAAEERLFAMIQTPNQSMEPTASRRTIQFT